MHGDCHHVEQIGQHRKDAADDEAHDPTGDGGQEAYAEQRLYGLGAESQAEDKAPDGQQDEEQPIAREAHREPEEDADKTGTGHN